RDGHIRAVVEINVNAIPVNDGWGRTASCKAEQPPFLLITRYTTGWETSCLFVQPMFFGAASPGPKAWEQAREFAKRANLPMPELAAYEMLAPFVDAKLRDLDSLYREDRIPPDSYLAQSANATTEVPVFQQRTSLLSNAVKKNISFRSLGTFVDYGIAYVVT